MQCPQCQHGNLPDAVFCEDCGTKLDHVCSQCQTDNRVTSTFCRQCGILLTQQPSASSPAQSTQRGAEAENRFYALLPEVIARLQSHRRVTYRTFKYILGIDDALLEEIRKEVTFRQVARDELGEGLVWTGEMLPITPPAVNVPSPPATADTTMTVTSRMPSRSSFLAWSA